MTTSLKSVMEELWPERRDRNVSEANRIKGECLTLKEIRKDKALTQTDLAHALGIRQATVAQMEKRSDLLLSTLSGYVEAMGGSLSLMVEFSDKEPILLGGLGNTKQAAGKTKKRTNL